MANDERRIELGHRERLGGIVAAADSAEVRGTMIERESTPSEGCGEGARYSYPGDLARLVRHRWGDENEASDTIAQLPEPATLEEFFSTCYQASMLREEERAVTFRAILAEPAQFASRAMPPEGLQRLEFSRPRAFHPGELRQLAVAAEPQRTLIGVGEAEGSLRIWGLINSGTRWLRHVQGGRLVEAPLPRAPVVHVDGAARLAAYRGDELIARLQGGKLSGPRVDVFESQWLREMFIPFRDELMRRHEAARNRAREHSGETWAMLEPGLPRRVTDRLHKRVISLLREAHHGGTLLFLPEKEAGDGSREASYIDLRYGFGDARCRSCHRDLVVRILNRLARLYGASHGLGEEAVSWREFETTTDDEIVMLDEALFEMAHLFAGLAAVDGALVKSKQHALLGFGGMISGRLPDVASVWRAVDLEGNVVVEEEVANVGARHRAAFRLVGALPGALAIVISQDGPVRFVTQRKDRITYWEHD